MAELGNRLGKLSLAILENFVEGTLGKKFVEELRSPTDRTLAIEAALEHSEQRFLDEFTDKTFAGKMFGGVSETHLGLLVDAIERFFDHPSGLKLHTVLYQIISESFQDADERLVSSAVELYIDILTEEFALADPKFRDKVRALSDLRSVNILRKVETLLSRREVGAIENTVLRSLHQLPEAPADFTGREEIISQLLHDFRTHKSAAITGLTGMGGVGKTALGLYVAHKLTEDYPDAQIFLDLKGTTEPLKAADIMRQVILSFEPSMDLRALDEKGMADAYHSVLHDKKALLFFDNARSAEQIVQPPSTCAVLVTSRWTFPVKGLKNHALDVMQPEDADVFLLELCPRIREHAAGLAKSCGYLPLALRIAGSFLEINENWPVSDYLIQLSDRKGRLATLTESRKDAELKTEPDLLAAFELSYTELQVEEQKCWRMLGVFSTSFTIDAPRAMWKLEENETRKLLSLYCRYSLLDYDEKSSRYSLHDLLAEYACSQMEKDEEQEARRKHAAHYKNALTTSDDLYKEGGEKILAGLRLLDLEWGNIRAGQAWIASVYGQDRDAAELCTAYPDTGANVLSLRLHPRERIQWLEAALSAARQTGDRLGEGNSLGNLGNANADLGDINKAIEYYKQQLVINHEIGYHRGEGNALGNLGVAYADLGDVNKAIEFCEQALIIKREIGDRRGEGAVLGNLGVAYADLGDAGKAIEFYEQSLVIQREIGDHQGEGNSLVNLGNAYADLGDTGKAIEFYEQALVIDREIGNRRGEGADLGSLGLAYADLGDVNKAIEFYEQSLVIKREIGDRQGEGNSLGNLGVAYRNLGDIPKAIEFCEQALVIDREIGYLRGEGADLGSLGKAYADLGDLKKAIEFYGQSLTIQREIGDRQGEGVTLANLGNAYADLGDLKKAIELYEQRLVISREIGNRRGEGNALGNLGNAYAALGDVNKAIEFCEQALVIKREIGDRRSEAISSWDLGLEYEKRGELEKAIDAMQLCVDFEREIGYPDAEKDAAWVEEIRKKLAEQDPPT